MELDSALELLLRANQLKRIPRAGWVMRGVAEAESVADHTFGVAFIALTLAELVGQPLDEAKLLTIALLHDLPEAVLGDIPTPATRYFPPGAKSEAEFEVLSASLAGLPRAEQWRAWWRESEERASVEGRLVRDADRLDMLFQAYIYERTTGSGQLEEFWSSDEASFEFDASRRLYEAVKALRKREGLP